MKDNKTKRIAILLVLVMIGAILATSGSTLACHTKTVTCSPSTSQDITDNAPNNWIQYDITCHLTHGCSSRFYIAFTVDAAPPGWTRTLKNDDGQDIIRPSAPKSPDIESYDWISIGDSKTYNVHLKVTAPKHTQNGEQAIITVNCWSTDNGENDLENDPVTTTTTVNIPLGIRLYPTYILLESQDVLPGDKVDFNITIEALREGAGLIDLSKDADTCYDEKGGGDWTGWGIKGTDYDFNPNPANLPANRTTETTLSIIVPTTAKQGDELVFITKGIAQANISHYHTTTCFVNIIELQPDLEISKNDLCFNPTIPHAGENVYVNITIHNIGEKNASNFEVVFTNYIPYEGDYKIITQSKIVTDTIIKNGGSRLVSFLWMGVNVTEGDHLIAIEIDVPSDKYPQGKIVEENENNNLVGIYLYVEQSYKKWIEGTMELEPKKCNPGDTLIVKGTAKYNSNYGGQPVENANVTIEIEGTSIKAETVTDNTGYYEEELTAPNECKIYKLTVDFVDEVGVELKDGVKLEVIFEVCLLAVSVNLEPSYCLCGESVLVYGKVTDPILDVPAAEVTIEIDGQPDSWDLITDPYGVYTKSILAPVSTIKISYTINVTVVKGELECSNYGILTVDIDTDNDSLGNDWDDDDDDDGCLDVDDVFPLNSEEWLDNDGDGIGNNADNDDDNDGFFDDNDTYPFDPNEWQNNDGDGIGNNADNDDDNDGYSDETDAFPFDPNEWLDTDGDGIGNNADTDNDNDDYSDENDTFPFDPQEWLDTDGDGIGNNADPDDDNDGFTDEEELEMGTDPLVKDQDPIEKKEKTVDFTINIILILGIIIILILFAIILQWREKDKEDVREEERTRIAVKKLKRKKLKSLEKPAKPIKLKKRKKKKTA